MNTRDTPLDGHKKTDHKKHTYKKSDNSEIQSPEEKPKPPHQVNSPKLSSPQVTPPQINDGNTQSYRVNAAAKDPASDCSHGSASFSESNRPNDGLSRVQQQFVLKFCRQLASVIAACEQSESAEIEVGRRHCDAGHVKVKLQAEREYSDEPG